MTARTWLITGVSTGFGREMTTQLLDRGDTVIGTVRRPDSVADLAGSIQLIRAALPHLRAQGGGRVIQLSSYGGQVAFPGNSLYHATKWGIEGFAESVAQEVAPLRLILGSQAQRNTIEVLRNRIAGFDCPGRAGRVDRLPAGRMIGSSNQ